MSMVTMIDSEIIENEICAKCGKEIGQFPKPEDVIQFSKNRMCEKCNSACQNQLSEAIPIKVIQEGDQLEDSFDFNLPDPQYPKLLGEFTFTEIPNAPEPLGCEEHLKVYQGFYAADEQSIAIFLVDGANLPYATISEYHDDVNLSENEFVVQSRNFSKKLYDALLNIDVFEATGDVISFGPYETSEPIWRLKR